MRQTLTPLLMLTLASTFLPSFGQEWWNTRFVISMMYDPPLTDRNTVRTRFQDAIDAGFNLFGGDWEGHNDCKQIVLYGLVRDTLRCDSVFFFAPRRDSVPLINFDGKLVWDEPEKEDSNSVTTLARNFASYTDKLCHVNLFPYYRYSRWDDFTAYLDLYCNQDSIPLPVLCFDNYFPHSCFTPSDSACTGKLYFSNLAEMRQRANDRPLWSYILTTEWLTGRDTTFQKAYLRLSAFAPVAYGAKGLLCYSYDCRDRQKVVRTFNYRGNAKSTTVYFRVPDAYFDAHRVLFGIFAYPTDRLADSEPRHPDIAVKTDEDAGKWHFKFSTSDLDTLVWDYTHTGYGLDSETIPFIVHDKIGDNILDKVAAVSAYNFFLVADSSSSWTFTPKLPDFNSGIFNRLDDMHVAAGRLAQGESMSLMIALDDTIRLYHNHVIRNDSSKYAQYRDFVLGKKVFQLLTALNGTCTDFYAVCHDTGNGNWSLYRYDAQDSLWTSRQLTGAHLDNASHFWVENDSSTLLCMQVRHDAAAAGGNIYYGNVPAGPGAVSMTDSLPSFSSKIHRAQGARNSDGHYDLYHTMIPKWHTDAVIGHNQEKTVRYQFMSSINRYIRQHLEPIVMNSTWKGCYHAAALPDTADCHVSIVDSTTTPVIKAMDSRLMAGIFEAADSIRYLVVVNKTNTTLDSASLTLRGRRYSVEAMAPRIDTGSTACDTLFNAQTMGTIVRWPQMTGGECVILRLKDRGGYFSTHRNSFLDADSLADINHRFDDETWKIDLAGNGFGSFDSSYAWYGNDTFTYPILADYNGDGVTDLALFRFIPSAQLLIDYSPDFGSWNISRNLNCNSLISYIGRFDCDDKADVAYVNDSTETLYIRYANDSLATIRCTLAQFGSSSNTRSAAGDYNGDGLDDLAAYHFTTTVSRLLVDYNSHGVLQGWNQAFPLSYIPAQGRDSIQIAVSDYDGDGRADFSYYDPADNTWNTDLAYNGFGTKDIARAMGNVPAGHATRPVASDYDGDGLADMSLYVYSGNTLYVHIWYARDGFQTLHQLQY